MLRMLMMSQLFILSLSFIFVYSVIHFNNWANEHVHLKNKNMENVDWYKNGCRKMFAKQESWFCLYLPVSLVETQL